MATIKVLDDRLNSFYSQNPDFDILKFNLTNGEADNLNWDNLDRETILVDLVGWVSFLNPTNKLSRHQLNPPLT